MNCPVCNDKIKKATWYDAVKRNGKCYPVSGEVEYNKKDDTFILDELIDAEIDKIEDFNREREGLTLFSFSPDSFTREDIESMNFGLEDVGARCSKCNSSL